MIIWVCLKKIIWCMQNEDFFISLQCRSHVGVVCLLEGWDWRTQYYRRLSTLCSDAMKSRKFQNYLQTQQRQMSYGNVVHIMQRRNILRLRGGINIHTFRRGLRIVVLKIIGQYSVFDAGYSYWNGNGEVVCNFAYYMIFMSLKSFLLLGLFCF